MKDGERQFRMKLPSEKEVCAFMAVGSRNGTNVATTLASLHPTWPKEKSFKNLVEATNNIGGVNFGTILKHPRCVDPETSKAKINRDTIADVQEGLKCLTEKEREKLFRKTTEAMKRYDEEIAPKQLHHLPNKRTRMEFQLVDDLQSEEIYDYCLLHGNNVMEMTIQSFFNLSMQVFPTLR